MKPAEQQTFVACYEGFYWLNNRVAGSAQELNKEYNTAFTESDFNKALTHESIVKYFEERGVPNPKAPRPVLQPKQLKFIQMILDPHDNRLMSQKMKECGVSSVEHTAWMRDPHFARLIREETTQALENGRAQVLRSIVREASQGNVAAQKFYMELTGEYTPSAKGGTQVNVSVGQDVRLLTQGILEILQRHVHPDTLALVANEFEELLFPAARSAVRRLLTPPKQLIVPVETDEPEISV